ncbi:UDP-N-acetylmuramate-alanine ligase [Thermoanaerobacter kivui]|uniref:UDP-N-acetylmuramate-alanine ligase n=1 Tax=Thermoanaerobacter kivui TaxID=2325 RepID=A0A097AQC1_THEKI|nr:Mur ligase family protein [Thermoanaerobacter kivui]AIS52034.1 UDP-N-acetylmuramate-alanine ligase [Thermoanaerobacter kivui]
MKNILIGGSRGKTTISKFIFHCVNPKEAYIQEFTEQNKKVDILIISNICEKDDFKKLKNYVAKNLANNIIINADDKNVNKLFMEDINSTLITCGMNPKSSITASSIVYEEGGYKFNYCVQRSFFNLRGELIEPMEIPVEIKMYGQYNIYNSLFVITVLLLLGYEIEDIKNAIKGFKNDGNFEILYDGNFKVMFHYARKQVDFINAFNALCDVSYENLYLLLRREDKEMLKSVLESNKDLLNIKEIIDIDENNFYSYDRYIEDIGENGLFLAIGNFKEGFSKTFLNYIHNLS